MPQTDQRADVGASYSTPTTTTTGATSAVTQPAGNAAAVDAAGLATGSTTVDDGVLDDIVGGMLGLLPLGPALQAAWSLRTLPQVRDWLATLPIEEVLAAAPEFVTGLVDTVLPDGASFTTGLELAAAAELTVGGGAEWDVTRTGATLVFSWKGAVDMGLATASKNSGKPLESMPLAKAMAEAGCTGGAEISASWDLPLGNTLLPETAYRCALDLDRLDFEALARDVAPALDLAFATYVPSAFFVAQVFEGTATVGLEETQDITGVGLTDGAGTSVEAEGEATAGFGYDAAGWYVESACSAQGELGGHLGLSNVFESTTGAALPELALKGGLGLRVRTQGTKEALTTAVASGFQDLTGLTFVVGTTLTLGGATTEEVTSFGSIGEASRYLLDLVSASSAEPAAVLDGWESAPRDPQTSEECAVDDLPDVELERSVMLALSGSSAADALLPDWAEAVAVALPDHGAVTGVTATRVEGRGRVGTDAVRAFLGSPAPAVRPTEEEVVDLERILLDGAVATASSGGLEKTPYAGRDLSRVAPYVAFDGLELVAEVKLAAEGDVAAGAESEAKVETTLTRRLTVDAQTEPELAAKLAAV